VADNFASAFYAVSSMARLSAMTNDRVGRPIDYRKIIKEREPYSPDG
jgi:hypothetical protein